MTYAITEGNRIVPRTTNDGVWQAIARTLRAWDKHGDRRDAWAVVTEALYDQALVDVQESTDAGGRRVVVLTLGGKP